MYLIEKQVGVSLANYICLLFYLKPHLKQKQAILQGRIFDWQTNVFFRMSMTDWL